MQKLRRMGWRWRRERWVMKMHLLHGKIFVFSQPLSYKVSGCI